MEYVKVRFTTTRPVYIDGAEDGPTNTILRTGSSMNFRIRPGHTTFQPNRRVS